MYKILLNIYPQINNNKIDNPNYFDIFTSEKRLIIQS